MLLLWFLGWKILSTFFRFGQSLRLCLLLLSYFSVFLPCSSHWLLYGPLLIPTAVTPTSSTPASYFFLGDGCLQVNLQSQPHPASLNTYCISHETYSLSQQQDHSPSFLFSPVTISQLTCVQIIINAKTTWQPTQAHVQHHWDKASSLLYNLPVTTLHLNGLAWCCCHLYACWKSNLLSLTSVS